MAWKIEQCLWTKVYARVYAAVQGFDWSTEAPGLVASSLENYTGKINEDWTLLPQIHGKCICGSAHEWLALEKAKGGMPVQPHYQASDQPPFRSCKLVQSVLCRFLFLIW
jgi:hypothetical protein